MKLVSISIENFRCYKNKTNFKIDDLTAIIGKNDIGKSAILEAIDGFFNESVEIADLSTTAENKSITLCCCFEDIPPEIVLDTSVASSPVDEGILNQENQLEVIKVFTFGARKTVATYLNAYHPSHANLRNILSLKNATLKSLARELAVDLTNVSLAKNPPLRKAIRDHIGGPRELTLIKVDGNLTTEDNLKALWSSIKQLLPIYSLFKSDKTFDDKDGDIKDPLQSAINEALGLPEIKVLLEEIEEKVKEYSTKIADQTIEKLKNFDQDISERLRSDFSKQPVYNKVFDLTLLNENDIPLNKRGSGIRRLVVLSFFQAQAERRKTETGAPSIIYAIEEPETSQHPNHQQMIIDALHELSKQKNVQVIFTTHSANLVREIPVPSLRFISITPENELQIEYGANPINGLINEDVIRKVIKTLGILPNPSDRVKVLVYVEGNHDVNALKRYSCLLSKDNSDILNLLESNMIGYVITGGSALKHYIEQKHLDGLGKPEVHIYDSDVPEYVTAVNNINALNDPSKKAFNTTKLELENYLHSEAIMEAYSENGVHFTLGAFGDQDDVPVMVAKTVYEISGKNWLELTPEKQKELASDKKKILNTQAVEKMTVARLIANGGYEEIILWLNTIKQFI